METKEEIIKAAAELFMRYGVRSVTMDEISRELSISKKTIYQYFKDKDEIVMLVTTAHMIREKEEYSEIHAKAEDPIMELVLLNHCMRKDFKEMNPSLLFDLQKYHRSSWNLWEEFKNEFIKNSIVENLTKGKERGYYRKEIDPDILATFRVEQVQLAFDMSLFPSDKYNFSEVQLMMFDHFVHGILTDKGRTLYQKYFNENKEQIALN